MPSRPRGLILGFYHERNAGDDRLAACIEQWLHGHRLTFLPHTEPPPMELVDRHDYALIGGGSVLDGNHGAIASLHRWSRNLKFPVFVAGATICSRDEQMLSSIRGIAAQGRRVWLRDERSAGLLGAPTGVTIAPDLSWLFPFRSQAGEPAREEHALVNLRPWKGTDLNPSHWRSLLASVFDRVEPWVLSSASTPDEPLTHEATGKRPDTTLFDPTAPARAGFVLAMRFHAIIFAIQGGAPFLAIDNSRKVTSLLEQLGTPWARVPPDSSREELADQVARARSEFTPERLRELATNQQQKSRSAAELIRMEIEKEAASESLNCRRLPHRIRRRMRRLVHTC